MNRIVHTLIALFLAATFAHAGESRPLNILLLYADDLGYAKKKRHPPEAWDKKHKQPDDDDHPVELYHLKIDVGQQHNLATQHPERVQQMQTLLKTIRDSRYPKL